MLDLRRREGLTIFLTTRYMDEAENCGRIAIIDRGEIVAPVGVLGAALLIGAILSFNRRV